MAGITARRARRISSTTTGRVTKLPNVVNMHIRKDQHLRGRDSSGGGYGDPLTRDPARVLHDVLEG